MICSKLLKVFAAASVFTCLFFTGCNTELSGGSGSQVYGSLTVSNTNGALAADVSSIKFTRVIISGSGIAPGMEPASQIVDVKDGLASVTVDHIPVGKNRIVTAQAYDASSNEIKSVVLRAVTDIIPGPNSVYLGWDTTVVGNVFNGLNINGYDVSSVTEEDVLLIKAAIKSDVDVSLIDAVAIAKDFILLKKGQLSSLKNPEAYIISSGESKVEFFVHKSVYNAVPYIWAWNGSNTAENFTGGIWPGSKMTLCEDGIWYSYTVTKSECMAIISNNGSDKSDEDGRAFAEGSWYYYNKTWYEGNPLDAEAPVCSWVSYPTGTVSGSVTLSVNATDNIAVKKIEFYCDDKLLGTVTSGSSFVLDTTVLKNGEHEIYAIAYDGAGNKGKTLPVGVCSSNANRAPVAVITGSGITTVGVAKSLSASDSYDPNGSIVSYAWSFGDGSTGSGESVKHVWSNVGKYTVELKVTDDEGATGLTSVTIEVKAKDAFVHRDFREETVYFMMTDRFVDGDKTNNNIWGDEYLPNGESQMYDYSEDKTGILSYYHGGDFKGIIDNLDYIKDMGFTAIWITPVVKQPEGRYYYDGSNGGDAYQASAFHGYWGYDFDQIDPHLHSSGKNSDGWDDYREFIQACHAKGIRVMQDIVINHGNHTAATAPTKWANYSVQTIMDGKEWAWEVMDPYFESVPTGSTPSKNGFYSYFGFGQCADLIDFGHLGEDGKDSRQHLINVYKKFIDAGVDAFRIDTMAYIPSEFAGEFADAMYNHAKELGNDYFYMIGEAWCGRYTAVERHAHDKTNSLHMLDMQLSCMDYPGEMQTAFQNNGDGFDSRWNNVMASSNVKVDGIDIMTADEWTKTAMFVDNHDVYRDEAIFNETQFKNALNYIYLFRGVPIVYYGTEAYYSWEGTHPSTNKEDIVARWMLGERGINHVKNNKPNMYKHIKMLNQIHSESEIVKYGEQTNISLGAALVYTRSYNGKTGYFVNALSAAGGSHAFDVAPGTYTLYTCSGDEVSVSTVTGGKSITLAAPANGFAFLDPK